MRKRTLSYIIPVLLGSAALMPVTAFAGRPPTCAQLATNPAYGLTSNPLITATASDNQGLASPAAAIVPATATDAAYCLVHLQFSSKSGPKYGYAVGESQTIGINIGLPLNSTDGGSPTNPTGYSWTAVNGAWNGKVENLGGGGLAGTLGSVTAATDAGYVGSITDGGHNTTQNGTVGNFAVIQATHQLDVGKITDFASESLHQQYLWALALADSYYGHAPIRNYWYGCSTGGRQGLELAQKWGEDFDGILAGAAVVYWDAFDLAGKGWAPLVNRDEVVLAEQSAITTGQFQNAVSHAIAACDVEGTDVVADGVVDDPRQCKYTAEGDPSILAAPAGTCSGGNCVTLLQAKAIDQMWEDASLSGGPHNHFGAKNWYGLMPTILSPSGGIGPAVGTGATNPERIYDWDHRDLTGNVQNLYSSRLLAAANPFGEPSPIAMEDELQLNESRLPPSATTNGATASTGSYFQNNDYQGIVDQHFRGKHVKIIHWSGGNDTNVWFPAQVRFYRATATALGDGHADYAGLSAWYRYYHAPGVGHCGGDVGASPTLTIAPDGQAQMFTDLVNWVEEGIEPQSAGDPTHKGILANGPGSFGTRPICPYPTTAIYNGTGATTVASNYHCGGNLDTPVTLCQLPITRYGHATSNLLNYEEVDVHPEDCEK
jgi:Tannase and feruloyl esterase